MAIADVLNKVKEKYHGGFPQQKLSFTKKNKLWRLACVQWADSKSFFNSSPVRNSTVHKKINYDLVNGRLHMKDIELILNPENMVEGLTPSGIQHYPIINRKLQVLRGEEIARVFDYRVVVTNPNALSEIEETKKQEVFARLQALIQGNAEDEDAFNQKLEKLAYFFNYEYQDMREIRANQLLRHYAREYNFPLLFNTGFMDAATVGEEIYQCDIRGGEPIIERVNPLNIHIYRSGYGNRIEDADVVIIEEYWSPGKVIDAYYDVLSQKDIDYLESIPFASSYSATDKSGWIDERNGFVNTNMVSDVFPVQNEDGDNFLFDPFGLFSNSDNLLPYDTHGNVKVLRVYWKSYRRIKKVKSYNMMTGEEEFSFYPETYVCNEMMGEEEEILYINEAWEGTKIGDEVFVNMRPRVVQYNRLSSPSRCHFGIVGSIYNFNEDRPYSLVDMMKPFNYLYDAFHDRLNKLMAANWGKILEVDFAKMPKGWTVDKWLYFAKKAKIAVVDSFKTAEGGPAAGKIAGGLNNNSRGYLDAELGQSISTIINALTYIEQEMSDVVGITRQREGQISNRETVGGIERATLQSSHITEWIFSIHDDVKKRVIECFLETAKIALKGKKKKFEYILDNGLTQIMNIDGDVFAEADFGIVVDNSPNTQKLEQQLESLAQAALQNRTISFSSMMKLYNSYSLAEKQRIIEQDEKRMQEQQQQLQDQQMKQQQIQIEAEKMAREQELQQKDMMNQRDNETKLLVAQINAAAMSGDNSEMMRFDESLEEQKRQFDEKMRLEEKKLDLAKKKASDDVRLKEKAINKKSNNV